MVTCAMVAERDMVPKYLAGTLSHEEDEAFEAHYFGCAACWAEVQTGLELRAAAPDVPARPSASVASVAPERGATRHRTSLWPWLALAATVVICAGVWQIGRFGREATPPVATPEAAPAPTLRSPSTAVLKLEAALTPEGSMRVEWSAVPQAAAYVVHISAADGTTILTRRVNTTSTLLRSSDLSSRDPRARLLARVEAEDSFGAVFATSARIELPARR